MQSYVITSDSAVDPRQKIINGIFSKGGGGREVTDSLVKHFFFFWVERCLSAKRSVKRASQWPFRVKLSG